MYIVIYSDLQFQRQSAVGGQTSQLPNGDRELLAELRQLGENLLNETLKSELKNRLDVAQSVIESKVATASVIDQLEQFKVFWDPQLNDLNVQKFGQFSLQFIDAFGSQLNPQHDQQDDTLNEFTKGVYSNIKANAMDKYSRRLTAYRDIANQKMGAVSQGTKEGDSNLMRAFRDFVDAKQLTVRDFFTFLRQLRKY